MSHKISTGFTLIEIIIVVALISLIVSLGYPSYTEHVRRAKITEATANLGELHLLSTQYYQDERTYLNTDGGCAITAPGNKNFTFSCTATQQNYTWTAKNKASSGLGSAADYEFAIDQDGNKSTAQFAGSTVDKNCWILKNGPIC